jgi:hypothetical protein
MGRSFSRNIEADCRDSGQTGQKRGPVAEKIKTSARGEETPSVFPLTGPPVQGRNART